MSLFLSELEGIIAARAVEASPSSYTHHLLSGGPQAAAQKVGEEAVEVVIAALAQESERLVNESADLLYHLLVLLRSRGISLATVDDALRRRHRPAVPG